MPNKMRVEYGRNIGRPGNTAKYIWLGCVDCGRERWVRLNYDKATSQRCWQCEGIRRRGIPLKNGRYKDKCGYIRVLLPSNSPFRPMAFKAGYILEHRLVMAQSLNRCLLSWEIVHHKNGRKQDNRLGNLELLPTIRQHLPDMLIKANLKRLEGEVERLKNRVTLLEAENILLTQNTPAESEVHEVIYDDRIR